MFHAFDAQQGVGNLADRGPLASGDQHLETVIVVEMHVHSGQNVSLKIVLDMSKLPRQVRHMMIVDERNGCDRLPILIPLLPDQMVPNQVADGFGAVGILAPIDQTIEIDEEMLIERDAESDKLLHQLNFSGTKFIIVARIVQTQTKRRQAEPMDADVESATGGKHETEKRLLSD